jgi:hypothetical protein
MNLHQNKPPTWLVHIPGHPWVLGQATGTLDHETHHAPDSGEATTFPHIVFSASHRGGYIRMAHFVGSPEMESQNCPGLESWDFGRPQLLAPNSDREEVNSRLLVVGSQIANLIPGPSFAHNLGCRCPNGQHEAIFDI